MAFDLQDPAPSRRSFDLLSLSVRVESAVKAAVARALGPSTPPTLAAAYRHAVFPGGGRLRPQLCLLVAAASGGSTLDASSIADAEAAAAAVELLHCASLVHDDLPCFDDADTRRGCPSTHRAYGQAMAVLVGDGLIVHAFRELAQTANAGPLVRALGDAAGTRGGLVAGQAWESEGKAPLEEYHRAKTASLFEAAAVMGAIAVGADETPWRVFGELLGRAYQAADDVADAIASAVEVGKPIGRDAALGRPSLVRLSGLDAARARVRVLLGQALGMIPSGEGQALMQQWIERLAARVLR